MKYIIIRYHDISIFLERVNAKLEQDYILVGGPFIQGGDYHQAMQLKE